MNYKNVNPVFNNIANEQGIEPGSPEWCAGGIQPYSGTTGNHAAYGWKHDHLLQEGGEKYVRAVIANYGHRRMDYLNAIVRQGGYESGGRPWIWSPELPGDELDGQTTYQTSKGPVKVSGPDLLHFHIGPLCAVADSEGYEIPAQGKMLDAAFVAKAMIKFFIKSLIGQCMKSDTQVSSYLGGERATSCILTTLLEAHKRGCVDPDDALRAYSYIEKTIIPYYEKIPGMSYNIKPALINGLPNFQLFNGIYWALPPLYWMWELLPDIQPKEGLGAIVKRHSQHMLDLETLVPGRGAEAPHITVPAAVQKGVNGKPVDSWLPYMTPDNVIFGSDWSAWGLTAQFVAAKVLESDVLQNAAMASAQKISTGKYDNRHWLVDAECQYIAMPKALTLVTKRVREDIADRNREYFETPDPSIDLRSLEQVLKRYGNDTNS